MRVQVAPDQGRTTPFSAPFPSALPRIDRVLVVGFLGVRAIHVIQGLTCVTSGRRRYRRPKVATAAEVAAGLELLVLATKALRAGRLDSDDLRLDSVLGLTGLLALAAATNEQDRTGSLNWMLPLTVGGCVGAGLFAEPVQGAAIASLLGATYAGTTLRPAKGMSGRSSVSVVNTISYPAFWLVARVLARTARKLACDVDEARNEAVEQTAATAAEAARNREHRLIHDSALQTLEALANGVVTDPESVRRYAAREAAVIRRALAGISSDGSLLNRLDDLVTDFTDRGLKVDLVADEATDAPPALASALCDATREALTNVLKHAGVASVVVRVALDGDGVKVTVRDHGTGFDPHEVTKGFGLDHSITGRLAEVGGRASISSSQGSGTRVELWVPA